MPSPLHTPEQHQIEAGIAEGTSWLLPIGRLGKLWRPIGQLLLSSAAEQARKRGAQTPDFMVLDRKMVEHWAVRDDLGMRQQPLIVPPTPGELGDKR